MASRRAMARLYIASRRAMARLYIASFDGQPSLTEQYWLAGDFSGLASLTTNRN
ncbi:MAG: hypothetical protein RIM23_02300 [Coleofasciculus sp. G3-WIS-01]|uniref:hypothetical protein n=1 Tax=Coleofasciculus sp. G3-WIS-01 TaxID=3069528 RepID=UPI0032F86B2A